MTTADLLRTRGWVRFPAEARLAAWAEAARRAAVSVTADPAMRARWLRYGGTWFVGVDALPNAADGSIGGVALSGPWDELVAPTAWHRAQLSVVHPGYPGHDPDEPDAARRYRLTRDAAHLDGLLAEGPAKRRHLREPHAFILGLALTRSDPGAAPFVIWEGSPALVRAAFDTAFAGRDPAGWGEIDVTEFYQACRAEVFRTCPRVELPLAPGEALLVHRHAVHGIAPWAEAATAAPEGRMTAWFRPLLADPGDWLARP